MRLIGVTCSRCQRSWTERSFDPAVHECEVTRRCRYWRLSSLVECGGSLVISLLKSEAAT